MTPDLRRVMYRAQEMGMTGGDYVYLYYTLEPSDKTLRPWEDGSEMMSEQRARRIDAFRSMKLVSSGRVFISGYANWQLNSLIDYQLSILGG